MTDTKIERLRGIADWLALMGWSNMATNVRNAADELERLGKIEAAAKVVCRARVYAGRRELIDATDSLSETLEANPCPTK